MNTNAVSRRVAPRRAVLAAWNTAATVTAASAQMADATAGRDADLPRAQSTDDNARLPS